MNGIISRAQVKLYQNSPYLQIKHGLNKASKNFSEAQQLAEKQIKLINKNPILTEEVANLNIMMHKKSSRGCVFLERVEDIAGQNKFKFTELGILLKKRLDAHIKANESLLEQKIASTNVSLLLRDEICNNSKKILAHLANDKFIF